MQREVRYVSGLELRASGNNIEGYAAIFNSLSEDLGGFRERIRTGAFARAIREKQDCRALFNHNPNMILGRTRSGTLRLSEDGTGLLFDCNLSDTSAGRDVRESVRRGDISQCSFGFVCRKDSWDSTGTRRELLDVDLLDVSPVTYPAYPQTTVDARSLLKDAKSGVIVTGCYRYQPVVVATPVDAALETERCRARLRLAQLER